MYCDNCTLNYLLRVRSWFQGIPIASFMASPVNEDGFTKQCGSPANERATAGLVLFKRMCKKKKKMASEDEERISNGLQTKLQSHSIMRAQLLVS